MTRSEAVPGAVVVRVGRHGNDIPGVWVIVNEAGHDGRVDIHRKGVWTRWYPSRLRLATPEEREGE